MTAQESDFLKYKGIKYDLMDCEFNLIRTV